MTDLAATALLFPGQGSQEHGMLDTVAEARPDLLDLACELVGSDPFERVADGTRFAQPAIYCAALAGFERLGRPDAACAAGHSLGELAALAAAGALHQHDGLRLAVERGASMHAAARGEGGMVALLGERDVALDLIEAHGLTLANDNAPEQLVASGPVDKLEECRKAARTAGLRALRLPIAGAFHSPAMEPAAAKFREALAAVRFREPAIPVLSCASAREFASPRAELADALTRPVRWRQTMRALRERGARRFLESGPGDVLTKLVERNPAPAEVSVD